MLKFLFGYNNDGVNMGEVYYNYIKYFELVTEMLDSSTADFQLPRLTATLNIVYDKQEEERSMFLYWFRQYAEKGSLVKLIVYDPDDPYITPLNEFFFVLDTFSIDTDNRAIKVVMTNLPFSLDRIVQYSARLTPENLSDANLAQLGIKDVYRLPVPTEGNAITICPSNAEEALLALAWSFDGARHNIGFSPAVGVEGTNKIVLVPSPSEPKDGVPRYSIEPSYIVEESSQEPEVVVTDLLIGTLEADKLVPIIPAISNTSSNYLETTETFKIFTKNGEVVAAALVTGLSQDFYSKDIVLLGNTPVDGILARRTSLLAVMPGKYKRYSEIIDCYYILRGSGSSNVSIETFSKEGDFLDTVTLSVPVAMNPNEYEKKALVSSEEVPIDDTHSIVLLPRINTDVTASSRNDFYIIKEQLTSSAKFYAGGINLGGEYWHNYPIKAYVRNVTSSVPNYKEVRILLTGDDYSLETGRIAKIEGNTEANNHYRRVTEASPITNVTLPPNVGTDPWSKANYINFGPRIDGFVGDFILFTVPASNGSTIVCFVTFTENSSGQHPVDKLSYITVNNFIGAHMNRVNSDIVIVTSEGWKSYDPKIASGNWFLQVDSGTADKWPNIVAMTNGDNCFALFEEVFKEDDTTTRNVYLMYGDNPFNNYALSTRKTHKTLINGGNYNPRDISYVVDLPSLSGGSRIPILARKVVLEVTGFDYKTTEQGAWEYADASIMSMPLLGTLCRYKIDPEAQNYVVGIISKVKAYNDGYNRLQLTITQVDEPKELF